jgi:Cu(I)/Ag(I) efflux system membrane fusion protein
VTKAHPISLGDRMNGIAEQQFKVSGNCEQCKERIETAAKSLSGVSSANCSVETKKLQVKYDPNKANLDVIQKTIAKVDHLTEKF